MRRRDGDHDARLADLDAAEPVVDRRPRTGRGFSVSSSPSAASIGSAISSKASYSRCTHVAAARAPAHGADEASRPRRLRRVFDLADHGGDVERLVDEPERAAGDGRDERDLVAVDQRVRALDVARGSPRRADRRARRRARAAATRRSTRATSVELEPRLSRALPQAGEETDGDPHPRILPAASGAEVVLEQRAGLRAEVGTEPDRCRRPPGSGRSRPGGGSRDGGGSSTWRGRSLASLPRARAARPVAASAASGGSRHRAPCRSGRARPGRRGPSARGRA